MPGTRRTLESLVTRIAARLMPADAASHLEVVRLVLRDLVDDLGVDTCFLRYNDHEIGATILVAEWPTRENVPDPDPIGVVYFRDADPVFAAVEHLKEPLLAGAGGASYPVVESPDYTERVFAASGWSEVSMVAVPLVSGQITTGVLGFVNEGGRRGARTRSTR